MLEVVVKEGLEVEELPPTLRTEVAQWPARSKEETKGKLARLQTAPIKATRATLVQHLLGL